ncbi:MAG: bifunctional hydroxymethylpyrimidine kinase/phosphomethylpyrimidine kinase [Acidimicrobiales bacterium]|nr:MAG: bifunctional hydroxymethylpyrimidine kinase/phosphomethylpyrimidine kinase [Acidimicrobiales bacterium]
MPIRNVLSIAGTDPSGGAGIQADLKTFSALGSYGMAVVTALVAQTTTGVTAIHDVPASFVTAQLETLLGDVHVDAVKIGMLANTAVIEAVAAVLQRYNVGYAVLDPVMVAKSGDRLLAPDAVAALRELLLPRVDLITPNLPEAADLLGEAEATDEQALSEQAQRLLELGTPQVLVKGGHLSGSTSNDVLVWCGGRQWLSGARVPTRNTHGTGCTLSSAIAALRPQRDSWLEAASDAKAYLTGALLAADQLSVGEGHGPVQHFHQWWGKA